MPVCSLGRGWKAAQSQGSPHWYLSDKFFYIYDRVIKPPLFFLNKSIFIDVLADS